MSMYEYVVIGGGMAGGRACDGIRKIDESGHVAVVTGEPHSPYERPPLSKGYLAGREGLDKVLLHETSYYADRGIDVYVDRRVVRLDPSAHTVELDDGRALEYGKLCLATGASARRLPLPGVDLPGVWTLRTIEDSNRIREAAGGAVNALVVGGSFIGSEVAASLTQLGANVTMVFPESRLLERIAPPALSSHIAALFREQGISILSGRRPIRFAGGESVASVALDDGTSVEADFVVLGVGVRLNTDLARCAGLDLGPGGEVLVDEYLKASAADVFAAGDIASWPDSTFGKRLRVEHWDVARRQGLRAGRAMAGDLKPYSALPYFFSDLFELSFDVWGDLETWDETVMRGSLGSGSYAFYYFDEGVLCGVLAVARPDSERKPMQALVSQRARVEEVAGKLADESVDLADV